MSINNTVIAVLSESCIKILGDFMNVAQTAERIKGLCQENKITINALIERIGASESFIYDMEKRNRIPAAEKIILAADVLNTSTDYLLGRTDEKKPPATQQEALELALNDLTVEELQKVLEYVRSVKSKRNG